MAETKKKPNSKKVAKKKAPAKKNVAKATATENTKKTAVKNDAKKTNASAKKTEKKPEHVSKKAKETQGNNWKPIAILLGAVAILLMLLIVLVLLIGAGNDKEKESTDSNEQLPPVQSELSSTVNLLIVEDPSCIRCQVDIFAAQVRENLLPGMTIQKISFESDEGQKIISDLDLNQLPTYLFSAEIAQRSDWGSELSGAFIPVSLSGETYYMLRPQFVPEKVMIAAPRITDTAVVIGDRNAPVTVISFSDYECPFCAIAEGNEELVAQFSAQSPGYVPAVPKIIENYVETGLVKMVFYNMPVVSQRSKIVHNAALCANEQGEWEAYHHKLFNDRSEWFDATDRVSVLKSFAVELGLDSAQFDECVDTMKFESQIEEETQLGGSYGVSGTPAFFVNKNFVSGAQPFGVFEALIEAELN